MYFKNLLHIKPKDIVLEIGPGNSPHWRSNFLVDKFDNEDSTVAGNFGAGTLRTDGKPFRKIKDNQLPFKNDSFDYIICSHVLEHINFDEIPLLLEEIFRVAPKAYIEFPAPLYDIIYNFQAHLNLMDISNNTIYCLPKTKISSLNNIFYGFINYLRKEHAFYISKKYAHLLAVGKEFYRENYKFMIFDNEEEFFNAVISKNYYSYQANIFIKIIERVKSFYYRLFKSY